MKTFQLSAFVAACVVSATLANIDNLVATADSVVARVIAAKPIAAVSSSSSISSIKDESIRMEAVTGYVQLNYFGATACSGQIFGSQVIAVGACLALNELFLNAMNGRSFMVSTTSSGISIQYYSDKSCTSTSGSPNTYSSACSTISSIYGLTVSALATTNTFGNPLASVASLQYSISSYYSAGVACTASPTFIEYYPVSAAGTVVNCGTGTTYSTGLDTFTINDGSFSQSFGTGSAPSSSDSSSSCFAGSETVELLSGDFKSLDEVKVGDQVLVASLDGKTTSFSPVIVVPHGQNKDAATFINIVTQSGREVKMTPDHILLNGACGTELNLVTAKSVQTGSCVQTKDGEEVVQSTNTVADRGVYTIVTKADGLLVVNGIIASPFAVNHHVANAFYSIHRFFDGITPALSSPFVAEVCKSFMEVIASALKF